MNCLLEFDAAHRTRKAAKYRQKLAFFQQNGSRLISYIPDGFLEFRLMRSRLWSTAFAVLLCLPLSKTRLPHGCEHL